MDTCRRINEANQQRLTPNHGCSPELTRMRIPNEVGGGMEEKERGRSTGQITNLRVWHLMNQEFWAKNWQVASSFSPMSIHLKVYMGGGPKIHLGHLWSLVPKHWLASRREGSKRLILCSSFQFSELFALSFHSSCWLQIAMTWVKCTGPWLNDHLRKCHWLDLIMSII